MSHPTIIDVRDVAPRERHPLLFNTFHALQPNENFELVNDHDPKPLYYQFNAEHPGAFSWDYLQQGPDTWRVKIGKTAACSPAPSGTKSCCS